MYSVVVKERSMASTKSCVLIILTANLTHSWNQLSRALTQSWLLCCSLFDYLSTVCCHCCFSVLLCTSTPAKTNFPRLPRASVWCEITKGKAACKQVATRTGKKTCKPLLHFLKNRTKELWACALLCHHETRHKICFIPDSESESTALTLRESVATIDTVVVVIMNEIITGWKTTSYFLDEIRPMYFQIHWSEMHLNIVLSGIVAPCLGCCNFETLITENHLDIEFHY